MPHWRPAPTIQVKALGLHWRDGKLLVAEVRDDHGQLKGVRPLGGHVEFGETWRDTLVREFQEELGIAITISGKEFVLESIYEHHGQTGHEILFLCEVVFPDGAFANQDAINFTEDTGIEHTASWYGPNELDAAGTELFPLRLREIVFGD